MSSESDLDDPGLFQDDFDDSDLLSSDDEHCDEYTASREAPDLDWNYDGDDDCSEDESRLTTADDEGWHRIVGSDARPRPIPFTATPGPKHIPFNTKTPVDYFNLFFNNELFEKIVQETNKYSDHYIANHEEYLINHPKSRVHQWIKDGHTNIREMKAFLGIIFNMGLIDKPSIESYWVTNQSNLETQWFIDHFNRNRFQLLLKFLHFNDISPPNQEQNVLYKIQPLIDHFTHYFSHNFQPSKNISLDESMIAFKGRTPHLRQYMPNKHHARFGIKLWCVCDVATGYTCTFEIFEGKAQRPARGNLNVTHATTIRLLEQAGLLDLGYNVGFDNYFSSPALMLHLYQRGTTATGTVRRNRVGLPSTLQEARLQNQETVEWRLGNLLCVKYKDGSDEPVLLSTTCTAEFNEVTNRRGAL